MAGTAVITQPTYLPWLGYFEQMARADTFVFLDNVQFVPRSWQCRNRLRGSDFRPFWLSVPVARHERDTPLKDIRISTNQSKWKDKHLRSIRHHLGAAPHFPAIFPEIEAWLMHEWELLVDLNISGIRLMASWLGLAPSFVRASELNASGRNVELLIAICKRLAADCYYSSAGSKAYIDNDPEAFAREGISLEYQLWEHPVYSQGGGEFVSHLAAIDAFCHIGIEAVRRAIVSRPTTCA